MKNMKEITVYDDNYNELSRAAVLLNEPIEVVVHYLVTEHLSELIDDLRNAHYNGL